MIDWMFSAFSILRLFRILNQITAPSLTAVGIPITFDTVELPGLQIPGVNSY